MRDETYRLVQQEYQGDGWKVVVASILLNRTRGEQVKAVIEDFFKRWPNPYMIHEKDEPAIVEHIRPLGLMNTRANKIIRLSQAWAKHPPRSEDELRQLPGVGQYAIDSYRIFVLGDKDFEPEDTVLKAYLTRSKGN